MMGRFVDSCHGNGQDASDLADAAEEPREWRMRRPSVGWSETETARMIEHIKAFIAKQVAATVA
jgi:hypothetical protein